MRGIARRKFLVQAFTTALAGTPLPASADPSKSSPSKSKQRATPTEHTVNMEGVQYNPKELTVRRGDRIVWANRDLFPHTVTADAKAFDSGNIAAGASWAYLASKAGVYTYLCTYHPTMKGSLKVLQ